MDNRETNNMPTSGDHKPPAYTDGKLGTVVGAAVVGVALAAIGGIPMIVGGLVAGAMGGLYVATTRDDG